MAAVDSTKPGTSIRGASGSREVGTLSATQAAVTSATGAMT